MALNRFFYPKEYKYQSRSQFLAQGIKCVFISYQKKDRAEARQIADYLVSVNVDVYFDENDEDLKFYRQENNPKGVVDSVKTGINNSSHMLVIVSPNTISSQWVPWEVGYGYDNTDVSVLTLKGIQDNDLPDYLKTVLIIRGVKSLNAYLTLSMQRGIQVKSHTMSVHPLESCLYWDK